MKLEERLEGCVTTLFNVMQIIFVHKFALIELQRGLDSCNFELMCHHFLQVVTVSANFFVEGSDLLRQF